MDARTIGSLTVSVIGLGCNNFGGRLDEAATKSVVDAAIAEGVTFLDTADVYGDTNSEAFLGRVLRGRRDQVVLATKFGSKGSGAGSTAAGLTGGARPEYVRHAVHGSRKRLRTDHIDLYQLHRPDPDVPLADTMGAMAELVKEGLVREVGCSNFSAEQLEEAEDLARRHGWPRFVSVQNEYSLMRREAEAEVLPACARLGVGFLPYFPLFSGILTGKYRLGQPLPEGTRVTGNARWEAQLTPRALELIEELVAFAADHGRELIDLAFAWLLAEPAVASVIAGATKPEQVRRNAATVAWRMSTEERRAVDAILAERGG